MWLMGRPGEAILGGALVGLGAGMWVKLVYEYPRGVFPELNVVSLLKKVKVSAIRPVACTVKGKIIGRGVPGLIWSEDFVMQDETGIIFLDYRQPLALWNFFFGLFQGAKFQQEPVTVTGWYRRAPTPYVEMRSLTVQGKTRVHGAGARE